MSSGKLRDTLGRMARAHVEVLTPEPFEANTFPDDDGYDELVLARDIPLRWICEDHLLPFTGTAYVGYVSRRSHSRVVETRTDG